MQVVDLIGAGGRTWTGTALSSRGILSPLRLPVPPLRHGPGKCADCTTPSKSVQDFLSNFWRLDTIRRCIHGYDLGPTWRLTFFAKKKEDASIPHPPFPDFQTSLIFQWGQWETYDWFIRTTIWLRRFSWKQSSLSFWQKGRSLP